MKINAFGPFIFANMLGSYLREKECGPITFLSVTSSIGSSVHDVFPGMYFYRASKAAFHNMLMSLYLSLNDKCSGFSRHTLVIPAFIFLLLGPGSVKTRMNLYGILSPKASASYLLKNISHYLSSGIFPFLSHLGKRLYV